MDLKDEINKTEELLYNARELREKLWQDPQILIGQAILTKIQQKPVVIRDFPMDGLDLVRL